MASKRRANKRGQGTLIEYVVNCTEADIFTVEAIEFILRVATENKDLNMVNLIKQKEKEKENRNKETKNFVDMVRRNETLLIEPIEPSPLIEQSPKPLETEKPESVAKRPKTEDEWVIILD